MAIKPILFNTEMVRAILDGRKTCTRRAVKTRRKDACGFYVTKRPDGSFTGVYEYDEDERMFENQLIQYKPGDILYVRETWCGLPVNEAGHFRGHPIYYYKADGDLRPEGWRGAWRPSIHMPKKAARIWLKVTDVRVERLQDIDGKGCLKEGIEEEPLKYVGDEFVKGMFHDLWDSTIKKSDLDRYGWDANPYVWVIEFERCEKPEEERR
nr:MAG TPA: ASCH domain protein [Caudoviricetes sp.]